jgi:hypothetical protein
MRLRLLLQLRQRRLHQLLDRRLFSQLLLLRL